MTKFASSVMSIPINVLASTFSPAGKNARLSILIYHRVQEKPDLLLGGNDDIVAFDSHLQYLTRHFNVLSLHEALQRLRDGTLPNRAACITFDDGYADNVEIALPMLQKYAVPATFFIAAGFIGGGMMWNDRVIEIIRRMQGDSLDLTQLGLEVYDISTLSQRRKSLFSLIDSLKYLPYDSRLEHVEELHQLIPVDLPDNFMMTAEQIKALHHAGMEIGGHTVTHPILARLEPEQAYREIAEGKEILEGIIGEPIRYFAYPNGKPYQDYHAEHADMIKKIGFKAAVSTTWGAASRNSDLFQLPRFTPWDLSNVRFVLRMVQNMMRKVEIAKNAI